ncbi:MAG: hypothetical protein OXG26_11000 [Caldilineaceae bacterium]|nr:hypothetical protein [Caldilineaceae bacterium]
MELFFPVPLDLISKKDENRGNGAPPSLHRLVPRHSDFASNGTNDYPLSWSTSESIESNADGLLNLANVSRYLRGNDTTLLLIERATLIEREPKIGIARSRETLSSEEQMLYRIEMSRFKNSDGSYGFVVDYECSESLSHRGLLKLGGEGKSFVYQNIVVDMSLLSGHLDAVKTAIQSTGRFKLYFATPAIFKHGWLPSWLSDYTLPGAYPPENAAPISLKLITAAVGKPVPVGGWDMAKGEAKPTLRAVPAGSVYYFELLDRDRIDDLIDAFHYQNISDERADEGFGLALIGVAMEETSW